MYKGIKFLHDRLIPDSLLARLLMILIIPTVLTQAVAAYIFYERHWSDVSEKMLNYVAGEVVMIAHAIEYTTKLDREQIIALASENMRLNVNYYPGKTGKKNNRKREERLELLYTIITNRLHKPTTINYINNLSDIEVSIQLNRGLLVIQIPNKRFSTPTTYIFILWMTGTAFILTVIAIIFCRNQVRSITKLSKVAEDFGKGIKPNYFKPSGALEVRKAANAFLQMQERIVRQISQRTEMLAGVSHDLRTPLTRMKLQLEMLNPQKEIVALQKDINDMEHMIQHYLDFAQGVEIEQAKQICLSQLLYDIINTYSNQKIKIQVDIEDNIVLTLKAHIFKRAIINIIDNSILYANDYAIISLRRLADEVVITFEDDGPGIPDDKRELVFKPFYRLDKSRNLNISGVGLGLAIVRDAINSHGGHIEISSSEVLSGLKIIITLPM